MKKLFGALLVAALMGSPAFAVNYVDTEVASNSSQCGQYGAVWNNNRCEFDENACEDVNGGWYSSGDNAYCVTNAICVLSNGSSLPGLQGGVSSYRFDPNTKHCVYDGVIYDNSTSTWVSVEGFTYSDANCSALEGAPFAHESYHGGIIGAGGSAPEAGLWCEINGNSSGGSGGGDNGNSGSGSGNGGGDNGNSGSGSGNGGGDNGNSGGGSGSGGTIGEAYIEPSSNADESSECAPYGAVWDSENSRCKFDQTTCEGTAGGRWWTLSGYGVCMTSTSCVTPSGTSTNVASVIGNDAGTNGASINYDNEFDDYNQHEQSYYGITNPQTWAVDFGNKGMLIGQARCSSSEGNNNNSTWTNPTVVSNLTDESSDPDALYCYCNVTGYKASGASTVESLSSSSVYLEVPSDAQPHDCQNECAAYCADRIRSNQTNSLNYRAALLGTISGLGPTYRWDSTNKLCAVDGAIKDHGTGTFNTVNGFTYSSENCLAYTPGTGTTSQTIQSGSAIDISDSQPVVLTYCEVDDGSSSPARLRMSTLTPTEAEGTLIASGAYAKGAYNANVDNINTALTYVEDSSVETIKHATVSAENVSLSVAGFTPAGTIDVDSSNATVSGTVNVANTVTMFSQWGTNSTENGTLSGSQQVSITNGSVTGMTGSFSGPASGQLSGTGTLSNASVHVNNWVPVNPS